MNLEQCHLAQRIDHRTLAELTPSLWAEKGLTHGN